MLFGLAQSPAHVCDQAEVRVRLGEPRSVFERQTKTRLCLVESVGAKVFGARTVVFDGNSGQSTSSATGQENEEKE